MNKCEKSNDGTDCSQIYDATDEITGAPLLLRHELFISIISMIASFPGEAYGYFVSNGEDYSRLSSDDVDGDSQEVTS